MSDLRTAAQQALKSLRGYRRELWCQHPCDAERALEAALEQEQEPKSTWQKLYEAAIDQRNEAVAEVKRLLEQPEHPPMRAPKENDRVICIEDESLGTVLWTDAAGGPYIKFDDGSYGQWMLHEFGKLFRYAALEQPEQEPVATVAMDVSGAHLSWNGQYLGQRPDMKIAMLLKDLPVGTLLFTHPPRREWRGLTEEEIYPLYSEPSSDAEMVEFARAIEAALRSKNYE